MPFPRRVPPLRSTTLLLVSLVSLASLASAQDTARTTLGAPVPVPVTHAVRLRGTIQLDGRLDEPAWADAPATDVFWQVDPEEGRPASQRTEVRVLYDADAIYVGARMHDTGAITARLGRRDGPLGDSDWFGVGFDSYHDHRTAFTFAVNPAGVRLDLVNTLGNEDLSWDAVWDVATTVDSAGWTAELRIPLSQLRFGAAREQTWGVLFSRIIGRRHEYDVSAFTPKREPGGVARYGHLDGLHDLQPGNRLELLPYTVSRAEYVDRGADPFRTRHEYSATAGLDLRYRVTPALTLAATLNPDFGQVEVDPAVVNLGVYETFFEEKRPFFVEGSEIFDFGAGGASGGSLFYSRRIGRAPSLRAPTPLSDAPEVTTILGAAKLAGKSAGWSVGVLEAVTAREEARYRDAHGLEQRAIVEPLASYLVARTRRELRGGQSFVGGVVTAVRRDLSSTELRTALRHGAYAGGLDFRHEFANRGWVLRGDAALSRVEGTTASILATQRQSNHYFQRPDAAHLALDSAATALTGYSLNAALDKQAGTHWLGSVAAAITSPGYEVNDLGYSYRTDRRDAQVALQYRETRPGTILRNWNLSGRVRSEHNFAWQPILTIASASGYAQTRSYLSYFGGINRTFAAYDDRLTRGGPLAVRPAGWNGYAGAKSDERRPLTLSVFSFGARADGDSWRWSARATLGVKSSTWWNLSVGPTFSRARESAQYVTSVADASYAPTFGRRYVFAPLHTTELGVETRLNVTVSPTLSLETYVQPLLFSGDYGDALQLTRPRSYEFVPYTARVPSQDFNLRSLRGNAVLRWEWRRGSTLFVAWQQSRQDVAPYGDFSFDRDRRALFDARPDNIVVVKANYWWNP